MLNNPSCRAPDGFYFIPLNYNTQKQPPVFCNRESTCFKPKPIMPPENGQCLCLRIKRQYNNLLNISYMHHIFNKKSRAFRPGIVVRLLFTGRANIKNDMLSLQSISGKHNQTPKEWSCQSETGGNFLEQIHPEMPSCVCTD